MESSKYLIAGDTTNWVEGLAEYYAKDEEKRRRYGEQLRQRDQAALKVMEAKSPIKMLEKLSSFSQTLGKLSKQQKKIAKQNAETERLQAATDWSLLNKDDRKIARDLLLQNEGIKDLKIKYAQWGQALEASESLSSEAKKILRTQHGGYLARLHEHMGFETLEGLQSSLRAKAKETGKYIVGGKEYDSFQAAWDLARQDGDEENFLKQYAFGELNKLGFNKEFIANNYYKPLDKWLGTKGVMSKLRSDKTYISEEEINKDNYFTAALKRLDYDPGAGANELELQLTELNYDKPAMVNRLQRLIKSDRLEEHEILAIKEGKLDDDVLERLGFKAGSTGKDLLSDEQWAQVDAAMLEHKVAVNNQHQAGLQGSKTSLLASVNDGSFAQNGGTQESFELEAQKLFALGLPKEDYNKLMDIKVIDQTKEKFDETIDKYSSKINAGEIDAKHTQDAIGAETNVNAQAALKKTSDDYIKVQRDNKIPDHATRQSNVQNRILSVHRQTSLMKAGKLYGVSEGMAAEIAGLENQIMWNLYQANPKTTTLKEDTEAKLFQVLNQRGFYAKPNSPEAGIYTPDTNGEHTNYRNALAARRLKVPNWDMVEANRTSTLTEVANWDQGFDTHKILAKDNRSDDQTLQDTMINTLGLLEPDDIVSPVQFLALDDKGSLIGKDQKFKTTPKLDYLAGKFPNKTKLQLWKAQARALINSDDPKHQDLVKLTKLKDKLKAIETASKIEETVEQFLNRTGDKGLLFHFYRGRGTWSPNVAQKMMNAYHSVIHSEFLVDEKRDDMSSFRTDADEQKELNKQLTNK